MLLTCLVISAVIIIIEYKSFNNINNILKVPYLAVQFYGAFTTPFIICIMVLGIHALISKKTTNGFEYSTCWYVFIVINILIIMGVFQQDEDNVFSKDQSINTCEYVSQSKINFQLYTNDEQQHIRDAIRFNCNTMSNEYDNYYNQCIQLNHDSKICNYKALYNNCLSFIHNSELCNDYMNYISNKKSSIL